MRTLALALLAAAAAFAADDPWAKVKDLPRGTELRIIRTDTKVPVLAEMDELKEESLLVILKNEQRAIPRDVIERIDSRPKQGGSRVTRESKVTRERNRDAGTGQQTGSGETTSTSTSVSIGSKPDFETVYRRTARPKVQP